MYNTMKKISMLALSIVIIVTMLAGCGTSTKTGTTSTPAASTPAASTPTAKQIVFKYGHNQPESTSYHKGAIKFAELAAQKSNGHLKVEVYPNAQLGTEDEMLEGVRNGTVDFAIVAVGTIAKAAPNFQVFNLPFLIKDDAHMKRINDSEIATQLIKEAEDLGKVKLTTPFIQDGFRYFFNNKKPIKTPEDMKGLKIRVPDWAPLIAATKLFGANPVAMAFNDTYLAVSAGTIDGLETTAWGAAGNKFADIVKYMSLDGHVYAPQTVIMNIKKYNSLSDEDKKIIDQTVKEAGEYQIQEAQKIDLTAVDTLKKAGMIVNDVDKDAFVKASLPVYADFKDKIDQNLVKKIQELRDK